MPATAEDVMAAIASLQSQLDQLKSRLVIDGSQVIVKEGLSDIDDNLGTIIAGEFRAGVGTPGHGFCGTRIVYPPVKYLNQRWNVVGVENDKLMFGLRSCDGVGLFGGGNAWLDDRGINLKNNVRGGHILFETGYDALSTENGIYIASNPSNFLAFMNKTPASSNAGTDGGGYIWYVKTHTGLYGSANTSATMQYKAVGESSDSKTELFIGGGTDGVDVLAGDGVVLHDDEVLAFVGLRVATTPGGIVNYGRMWAKAGTPTELWFTDSAGGDHQIAYV